MDSGPPADLSEKTPIPTSSACRFNPWLFFGFLAGPGILSVIVMFIDQSNYGESAFLTLIVCSFVAGLVCGVHFTLAQGSMATGMKVVVGIVSVVGCTGGAIALGLGGCYLIAIATNVF